MFICISLKAMRKRRNFLKPRLITKYTEIYVKEGFRGVIKKGGWKILFYFFIFYLIRDSILYLLIPYLIGKGFIDNFVN